MEQEQDKYLLEQHARAIFKDVEAYGDIWLHYENVIVPLRFIGLKENTPGMIRYIMFPYILYGVNESINAFAAANKESFEGLATSDNFRKQKYYLFKDKEKEIIQKVYKLSKDNYGSLPHAISTLSANKSVSRRYREEVNMGLVKLLVIHRLIRDYK